MRISVIIPTFGHPEYLAKSIESVVNQTFSDWELIVVDDNDPDSLTRIETENLMKEVLSKDKRIKYIQHDRNRNGAVARNTGFSAASGEFISLLDSDDVYLPCRLEKCLNAMQNVSDKIVGVYTGCEFHRKGKVYYKSIDVETGNHLVKTLACTFGFFTGSNIFVKKSVVDELNGFDSNFIRHQDYEFLVRLFLKYDLKALPEILVIKNNEGFNHPNLDKTIMIKNQYLHKFSSVIDNLPDCDRNYILNRQNIAIAETALRERKFAIANKYYKIASDFGRLSFTDWKRRLLLPIVSLF